MELAKIPGVDRDDSDAKDEVGLLRLLSVLVDCKKGFLERVELLNMPYFLTDDDDVDKNSGIEDTSPSFDVLCSSMSIIALILLKIESFIQLVEAVSDCPG